MGTTNIAMLGIVHEELTEDNHEYWKVCLERYLISQGLWDVVSGTKVQPAENANDYEDWRGRNALALHAVRTHSTSSGKLLLPMRHGNTWLHHT